VKNLLDYDLGVVPNEFAMQDILRNVENIIDVETDAALRQELIATFREWRLANLKFGRLLRQQDERMFAPKK
jgi:hypothetical protein